MRGPREGFDRLGGEDTGPGTIESIRKADEKSCFVVKALPRLWRSQMHRVRVLLPTERPASLKQATVELSGEDRRMVPTTVMGVHEVAPSGSRTDSESQKHEDGVGDAP